MARVATLGNEIAGKINAIYWYKNKMDGVKNHKLKNWSEIINYERIKLWENKMKFKGTQWC